MADQKLTDTLAALVRANAARGPLPNASQVSNVSAHILSQVPVQNPYQSNDPNQNPDIKGPSVINRILDIMSRPLYGVLNPAKEVLEENRTKSPFDAAVNSTKLLSPITQLPEIWAGLSGKEKTTGRDIVDAAGGENLPGAAKFGIGLGIDVAFDPLNAIGGIGKVGKAAQESTAGLNAVEEGTGKAAQSLASDIQKRAAEQASKLNVRVPVAGEPAPPLNSPPRLFQAGPGPGLAEEMPNSLTVPRQPVAELASTPHTINEPAAANNAVLEALQESLTQKKGGRSAYEKLAPDVADVKDPAKFLRRLTDHIGGVKSPVVKSMLRQEADKLRAGIKPASILSEARVAPPEFPQVPIGARWQEEAVKAATRFADKYRMKNINHIGQTNLYNSIRNAAIKVRKDRRDYHVLQMLRIAEQHLLDQGKHLVDAEGISVRLSDIANISGGAKALNPKLVDDFRKARPSQQVEDLKAFDAPRVVTEILDPVIRTGADIAESVKALPPSQTVEIGTDISKELTKIAENAGASSREARTAKAFIDDLFNPSRDRLYSPTTQEARNLVRHTAANSLDTDFNFKVSNKIYEGLGANPKVLGRQVPQGKVTEGIMTKFATWWGAKDLKPFSKEYIDTARNVAAAFAETMTPLVRNTTNTQRLKAWSVATGKISAADPQEQALADQFSYIMQRLMGTHGITENSEAVVLRSNTLMKELNEELPKSLRFTDRKVVDELGNEIDYRDAWMHSWKEWKTKEPAETMYQITRALQLVTRKNAMWDDAAARWGMPLKKAEFQHVAKGVDRLAGIYFPKEIAEQISNLQRQLDRDIFKQPNKAIALFDQVQRMWKTGVTIYSPSHHIRNLNGDIYLAALDGVVSPKPYMAATKVLHAYSSRYKDMEQVFNIMDPKLRESALRARPGNVVVTTRRGEKLTSEQVFKAAESQGLFIRAMHIEDLMGDAAPAFGTFGTKFQPLGGKVYGAATRVSELRDHWVRLAHFIDILQKSKLPLRDAVKVAGHRVKKFHPDGTDLTGFEQNVLRRLIPFYSWLRKSTPLIIEGAIMRPHISVAFPKVMANIQYATGIESNGPGDPFPMDQMFPEWIEEKGIGPILHPGSGLGRDENWRGETPGYTVVNPTSPFTDQVSQLASPEKLLLSSLTPGIRVPVELLTGQTSLGIPLENVEGGVPGHLAQQIPAVGIGARLTGATRDNEPWNPEQLINWLTSAGVTGTGPYQGQAQAELRQQLAQMAAKNRGDYR